MSHNFSLALAAAILCLSPTAYGAESPDLRSPDLRSAAAPPERIAALIGDLDDPAFAIRQEATEQLQAAGSLAVGPLETTAAAGSREAATRAFAILKQHFQNGDNDLKASARAALTRLADRSDPSAAQRARDIINPPRPVVATSRFGPPVFGPAPAINAIKRVSVSDMNGRKSVEIDERERRVKIVAPPTGNIEVEVTDKQNPAAPVRRFAAKDAAELAQKDPEMGRLYDQHLGPRARAAGNVPPLNPRPGQPAFAPIARNPGDAARLQIQSLDATLNRYRQRAETDPTAQRMVEALEQTKARLQDFPR